LPYRSWAAKVIAAIWQLHMAAADAMLEIAQAAEAAWLRAEGERSLV
jgi:hypothetical protein